ncbi:MAG: DMT family transporter [Ferruginibacter sp.]|nr:DMT family transporter [Ferruginibacter sp.]
MKDAARKIYITGSLITFAGAILFSTKAIFVKLAFAATHTDAITLLALRMVFALPFYLAIAFFYSSRDTNVKFTNRQWIIVIAMGLTGYYLSSLFDFMGLQFISAGLERLILFLYPTFAVLLNAAVFKHKISRMQMLALVLTYIGIGIAFYGELKLDASNPDFLLGSFLIFLCALTFSVYLVGSGKLIPMVGATKFTAYAMTAASVGVISHYFLSGNKLHHFEPTLLQYGVLLAIIATVIPTFLISNGLKKIGSNNVAIISSIGPVSTILQAHFILGEPLTATQIGGTFLVIAGVLLTGWRNRDI